MVNKTENWHFPEEEIYALVKKAVFHEINHEDNEIRWHNSLIMHQNLWIKDNRKIYESLHSPLPQEKKQNHKSYFYRCNIDNSFRLNYIRPE